jgi:hypothetical protein
MIPGDRVVNIIYDKHQDRYFSFNSTIPSLLHVCFESRKVGLETYHLCFGTNSHSASIPFDLTRDILLFDDWLANSSPEILRNGQIWFEPVQIGPMGTVEFDGIRRIAINYENFYYTPHRHRSGILQTTVELLARQFLALENLYIAIECINPYSKGRIKIIETQERQSCLEAGETQDRTKGCDICTGKWRIEGAIKDLEDIRGTLSWKVPNLRLVGACRDEDWYKLGCYTERERLKDGQAISGNASRAFESPHEESSSTISAKNCEGNSVLLEEDHEDDESEAENEFLDDDQDAIIPAEELRDILADQQRWLCQQQNHGPV